MNIYSFLALRRFSDSKLNNLNIENKASCVDFHLPNSNIYIELKCRKLSSDDYTTNLLDKKVDIWISSKRLSEACIYIYVLALLMVNTTLSSTIKNYLKVLK